MTPAFRVTADSVDVTAAIAERLIELRIEDASGIDSDMVTIRLDDRPPAVALPRTGAELQVSLGYDDKPAAMGLFAVDEIGISGPPRQLSIRARAANLRESLKARKTRPWDDVTLADILVTIAGEHGYAPKIADSLSGVSYDHLDQTNESDLALLTRLASQHGAVSKPVAGNLVLVPAGEARSITGKALPEVALRLDEIGRYEVTIAERGKYAAVVGRWHDTAAAAEKTVTVGAGDPAHTLPKTYPDAASAEAAARSKHAAFERGVSTISFSCPGDPRLAAEGKVTLSGGRPGLVGPWILSRVTHVLDSGGYRCDVEGETPK